MMNLFDGTPGTVMPEIIILEGRKRVGGRINSYPMDVLDGNERPVRVDLGISYHASLTLKVLRL